MSYFRKFIKNFYTIASLLYDATTVKESNGKTMTVGKQQSNKYPVVLSEAIISAFEILKRYLTTRTEEEPGN